MIAIADALLSFGNLIFPPLYDFIKKKFLPEADSPTATLSTLATTNPQVIPDFIDGQARLLEAQTKWFNRDVVGEVSLWVRNLRASIRPIYVILGILYSIGASYFAWTIDPGVRYTMEVAVNSWFGCRIRK